MNHRLPADVPESGKRYDLTLTGAGLDKRKRELVMFVIDNGAHKGVRVDSYLTAALKQSFIADADVPEDQVSTLALDALKYGVRISAQIGVTRLAKDAHGMFTEVNDEYKETNVYVHYDLSDFAYADAESELAVAFKRKEGKFTRKNSDPVPPEAKADEDLLDVSSEAADALAETATEVVAEAKPKQKAKRKTTPKK